MNENQLTQEVTLKNRDSSSSPIVIVKSVKTPVQLTIRPRLLSKGEKTEALTNWEDEAPPTHIERKATRSGYHYNTDDEPNNGEAPQYEASDKTNDVEDIACVGYMW